MLVIKWNRTLAWPTSIDRYICIYRENVSEIYIYTCTQNINVHNKREKEKKNCHLLIESLTWWFTTAKKNVQYSVDLKFMGSSSFFDKRFFFLSLLRLTKSRMKSKCEKAQKNCKTGDDRKRDKANFTNRQRIATKSETEC